MSDFLELPQREQARRFDDAHERAAQEWVDGLEGIESGTDVDYMVTSIIANRNTINVVLTNLIAYSPDWRACKLVVDDDIPDGKIAFTFDLEEGSK